MIDFTVYTVPQPQGSIKAFAHKRTGAIICTSTNKGLKPFRTEVCQMAREAMSAAGLNEPMAPKHTPVEISVMFTFAKPESVPKKRMYPVVKPDIDKLLRAVLDALTGVVYHDDSQVVNVSMQKVYGDIPMVKVVAQ